MASLPWLAYVPIPGLAWLVAVLEPDSRFVRYHARQGGMVVGLGYIGLILLGLLARASSAAWFQGAIGAFSIVWLLAAASAIGFGIAGSARGQYVRVRGAWDLLSLLGR